MTTNTIIYPFIGDRVCGEKDIGGKVQLIGGRISWIEYDPTRDEASIKITRTNGVEEPLDHLVMRWQEPPTEFEIVSSPSGLDHIAIFSNGDVSPPFGSTEDAQRWAEEFVRDADHGTYGKPTRARPVYMDEP